MEKWPESLEDMLKFSYTCIKRGLLRLKSVTPPYLMSMLKSRLLESRPRALSPSVFTRLTLDLVKVGNDG